MLVRDIPWETYMTARLISDRDLQLIRRYDKKDVEVKASLLEEVRIHIIIPSLRVRTRTIMMMMIRIRIGALVGNHSVIGK